MNKNLGLIKGKEMNKSFAKCCNLVLNRDKGMDKILVILWSPHNLISTNKVEPYLLVPYIGPPHQKVEKKP